MHKLLPTRVKRHLLFHRRQVIIGSILLLLVVVILLRSFGAASPSDTKLPSLPEESVIDDVSEHKEQRENRRAPWQVPKKSRVLIPKRLHHFFDAGGAPAELVPEVITWAVRNPDYQVYFWDAQFVEENILQLPEYKNISEYYWRNSSIGYERQLIARLLILHQYGGVLPELHMRALGSVTQHLTDTTCEMAQERIEKAILMYSFDSLPSVSVLACQAGHPFLKFFLRKITDVKFRTGARVLQVNTPQFIVHVYTAALSEFNDMCAASFCDISQRVFLADPDIFMPVMEVGYYEHFIANCKSHSNSDYIRREACFNLEEKGNREDVNSLAMPIYADPWRRRPRRILPLAVVADGINPRRRLVGNWKVTPNGNETAEPKVD